MTKFLVATGVTAVSATELGLLTGHTQIQSKAGANILKVVLSTDCRQSLLSMAQYQSPNQTPETHAEVGNMFKHILQDCTVNFNPQRLLESSNQLYQKVHQQFPQTSDGSSPTFNRNFNLAMHGRDADNQEPTTSVDEMIINNPQPLGSDGAVPTTPPMLDVAAEIAQNSPDLNFDAYDGYDSDPSAYASEEDPSAYASEGSGSKQIFLNF